MKAATKAMDVGKKGMAATDAMMDKGFGKPIDEARVFVQLL